MILRPDTRGFRRTFGVEPGSFFDHVISTRGPQHSDKTFRACIFILNLGDRLKIEINKKDFHKTLYVTHDKIYVVDNGIFSVSFLKFFFYVKTAGSIIRTKKLMSIAI